MAIKGTPEEFERMEQELIEQKAISFRNMDNDARKRFLEGGYLQRAVEAIMNRATDMNNVIYVRAAVDGQWATVAHQLHPEEFEQWMENTFVGENGKFYVDYQDREYYSLTDGDRINRHHAPAFVFDQFQVVVANAPHREGVSFSKWYYTGHDEEVKKWIRERYQIADHVPTKRDTDLMEPCAIKAILLHPMTDTRRQIIKDYLYSKQRTRFILVSSLAVFAEEMDSRIWIYGLDGTTILRKFSPNGNKHWDANPANTKFYGFDKASTNTKKNGVLFDKSQNMGFMDQSKQKSNVGVMAYKLVSWDDHMFILEDTPFGCNSAQLIDRLMKAHELAPIPLLQRNVFSLDLPLDYVPESMYYSPTYLANPQRVLGLDMTPPWTRTGGSSDEEEEQDQTLTIDNIDNIDDNLLPTLGYRLFLKELIKLGLDDVLAVGGPLKYFLKQSIHGGSFSIATKPVVEGGVIMLDRNSNHPYAFSQIDFPRGTPRRFPSGSCHTLDELLQKPVFCIDCDAEYTQQHPLDYPSFRKRMIINNIDARNPALKITHIYRGYYWDAVAKTPLSDMIHALYRLRPTHPKIKKVLNSLYGKLIEKPNTVISRGVAKPKELSEITTSPLIKNVIIDEHDRIVKYYYYNDIDYKYNYTMIASLLLAQQRKNMRDTFTFCLKNSIPMYYSAVDSLAIPASSLHLFEEAGMIGSNLGQFKIEAQNDTAIFVRKGLYYCGMRKIVTSLGDSVSYQTVPQFAEAQGMTVEQMFRNMVDGKRYTLTLDNGRTRTLGR